MINSVRNTVLSILNKNNYGYISPADFNLFAKQAQLQIFDEYFSDYNKQLNKENARQSGTGYANISKSLIEVIDFFSVTNNLTNVSDNTFSLPSETTTGDDYYLLNKVLCYDTTTTPRTLRGEAEYVTHSNITLLNTSHLTAPSINYPAYTTEGSLLTVFPASFNTTNSVQCQYIRYPKAPQWTFSSVTAGEPIFNPNVSGYQDFELAIDDEYRLVNRILQQCGISIREGDVYQYANSEEIQNDQQQG
tara:strand:- start:10721 stop:11464 length:744 start_codon:yes stop_codon:yes gene_type:complete